MKLPSPGFLITAFAQVLRRFPAAMLCAVAGAITLIIMLDINNIESETRLARYMITFILGISLQTAIVGFGESRKWAPVKLLAAQGLGVLVLVGCWWWLDTSHKKFEDLILPQYMALLLVLHLAVAVAPYIKQGSVREFWEYNRQLFANLVIGASFTLILFAGLSIAAFAIDQLFGIHIRDEWYMRLFVMLGGVFNTAYFLHHFPNLDETEKEEEGSYNWVFRTLCKFILIPIVLLYFLILYAFGAKIGLEWNLPQGWIGSLVIGFSVAGIFTYLLNFYLPEQDPNILVVSFKRWFWWVLLPLTGLLFLAIGRRISDYGVTEERFIVATLGVWLLLNCLYFLFSKTDNIKFIPISLGIFALAWSFGPLSALNVSIRSQQRILITNLERIERFASGSMKPGNKPVTDLEYQQISSAAYYLSKKDGLKELLPVTMDSLANSPDQLLSWLKILPVIAEDAIKTVNISPKDYMEPMPVQGFDIAYRVDLSTPQVENREIHSVFEASPDGLFLEWYDLSKTPYTLIERFSLKPALNRWAEKMEPNQTYTYTELTIQDRSILLTGTKGNIRLIVENGQIEIEGDQVRLESANSWILLKKK